MEWNFCALRHMNMKHEHLRNQWDNWVGREEEARVQEWHAQFQLNKSLRAEMAKIKERSLVQDHQIYQLQNLVDQLLQKL